MGNLLTPNQKEANKRVTKKINALTAERDLLKKMVGLGANEILLGHKKYSKILGERNALLKKCDLLKKVARRVIRVYIRCYNCDYINLCKPGIVSKSPECIELHIKQAGEVE